MGGLSFSIVDSKPAELRKMFKKQRYPRKLKKAIKKAWRFEEDSFMTHISFEPVVIRNNKIRGKVMKMIKTDGKCVELPLWNCTFIRFEN